MAIVIDSSVFCAFANKDDIHHEKATNIIKEMISGKYGKTLTTDYVFDETVTVALRRSNKRNAIELGNFLLNSEIFIAKIDSGIFNKAWNLFQKSEGFSFTDCSILAFMKTFEIKKVATFDKEFKKIKWIEVVED